MKDLHGWLLWSVAFYAVVLHNLTETARPLLNPRLGGPANVRATKP